MGLNETKPVFGVSDKASFKPVSSATETSKKIEISPLASLYMILSEKTNNKGADKTAWIGRLVYTCVVHKPPKTGFLVSRPKLFQIRPLLMNKKILKGFLLYV